MFIKVREEMKQPVGSKDFWITVLIATIIVCLIGTSMPLLGKASLGSHKMWSNKIDGLLLLVVWAVTVYQLIRHGQKAFPLARVGFLVAYTV